MSMKKACWLLLGFWVLFGISGVVFGVAPQFKKLVLSDKFHSEGAAFGDFNKDGIVDVVSGHFWYEGPDFVKTHQIYEGEDFNPEAYSNCFVMFVDDFNGDGWDDIVVCPHPGETGYWYENPKGGDQFWKKHEATIELGNESQCWLDVDGDGQNELTFNRNGWFGYIKCNKNNPYEPWKFVAVSNEDPKYSRYCHGNGAGDVNGDGRIDLIDKDGWWEAPEDRNDCPWKFHAFPFAEAASNILVYDVDGDGLNDVVTSTQCHLYGFAWYKQFRKADGCVDFVKNELIPSEPADDFFPKVSQLHALDLADMNGDGILDVVTGKRWWAHGSKGDVNPNDPAVLMWWETKRNADGTATLIPHIIDDESGVGTQVLAKDINGDNVPDIIVGNKRGTFLFLSK